MTDTLPIVLREEPAVDGKSAFFLDIYSPEPRVSAMYDVEVVVSSDPLNRFLYEDDSGAMQEGVFSDTKTFPFTVQIEPCNLYAIQVVSPLSFTYTIGDSLTAD